MHKTWKVWRSLGAVSCLAAAALLGGCGGGGSDSPPPAPPTPVPDTLAITAPTTSESANEVAFTNSAASVSGLSFAWDFGDGTASTEASPKHKYAKGGEFDVVLKISNSAGSSRTQTAKLSITNLDNVKGLTCSGANSGGWCWQQPQPNGNPRNDTTLVSASTVFSVDDGGGIYKSTDAGATWSQQASGVTTSLTQVKFSSPQVGWIVGLDGVLLRTTDGGDHWARQQTPEGMKFDNLGPLTVVDQDKAIFANSGTYTNDGGKTWAVSTFNPNKISAQGVFWRFEADGVLWRSTNFGATKTAMLDARTSGFTPGEDYNFELLDEQTLAITWLHVEHYPNYTTASQRMLLSFDGGANWRHIEATRPGIDQLAPYAKIKLIQATASGSWMFAQTGDSVQTWYASSVDGGQSWLRFSDFELPCNTARALVDGQTLLMYCGRFVWRSEDTGKTWSPASIASVPGPFVIASMRRLDSTTLGMQDTVGRSFTSTDGGRSWNVAADTAPYDTYRPEPGSPFFPDQGLVKLTFLDGKRGLMVSPEGVVKESTNGGLTWQAKARSALPGNGVIKDLQFVNARTGWLLQADGRLFQSTDAGLAWDSGQLVRGGLSTVQFTDDRRGWGTLLDGSGYVLTRDGGQTWITFKQPSPWAGLVGLYFGSGNQITIYGSNYLLASSQDDGKTWSSTYPYADSPFGLISKVAASDDKTLWRLGALGLDYSKDGGQTWTNVLGSINDFAFSDALHGWAVSNDGLIKATVDGGKTWVQQPSGTRRSLRKLVVQDSKTAWILGSNDTLLATGNGGL